MLKIEKYISPLDTKRFGFKTAVVDFQGNNDVSKIISFLDKQKIKLIITKVKCEDIRLINELQKSGFLTMDFQVAYDYYGNQENEELIRNKNIYPVRKIKRTDIPHLIKLTEKLFSGFGHYFADKKLDPKKCLEIYKDWTLNVCTKKNFADVVFAAYDKKLPIGFFAFKEKLVNDSQVATGVIGAVSSEYGGKNVFQSLLLKGIDWAGTKKLKLKDMKMHTTNYPVNAAFSKLGFRISNCLITMHRWQDEY